MFPTLFRHPFQHPKPFCMSYSIIAQLKFKKPTDQSGTIIIRAFLDGKPAASKSTGYKINRDHWNYQQREIKPGTPNAQLLNMSINKKIHDIEAALLQKEIMGAVLNKQHIIQAVNGSQSKILFIEYCKKK